jgi:hypothetical protein
VYVVLPTKIKLGLVLNQLIAAGNCHNVLERQFDATFFSARPHCSITDRRQLNPFDPLSAISMPEIVILKLTKWRID